MVWSYAHMHYEQLQQAAGSSSRRTYLCGLCWMMPHAGLRCCRPTGCACRTTVLVRAAAAAHVASWDAQDAAAQVLVVQRGFFSSQGCRAGLPAGLCGCFAVCRLLSRSVGRLGLLLAARRTAQLLVPGIHWLHTRKQGLLLLGSSGCSFRRAGNCCQQSS